jgi:hypothetical protein
MRSYPWFGAGCLNPKIDDFVKNPNNLTGLAPYGSFFSMIFFPGSAIPHRTQPQAMNARQISMGTRYGRQAGFFIYLG